MTTPAKVDNEVINEHGKPYNNTSFIDGLISNFHLPKRENGSKVSFFNFNTQKHSIPKTPTIKEFSNYIKESKPFKEETKPTVPLTHYKTKEFKPIKVENAFTKNMNIATIKPMQHKNPQYYEYKLDKYKDMTSLALRELDKQVAEESGDYDLEKDSLEFMDNYFIKEAESELFTSGRKLGISEQDIKERLPHIKPAIKQVLQNAEFEIKEGIENEGMGRIVDGFIEKYDASDGKANVQTIKQVNVILNKFGIAKIPLSDGKVLVQTLVDKLKEVKELIDHDSDSESEYEEELEALEPDESGAQESKQTEGRVTRQSSAEAKAKRTEEEKDSEQQIKENKRRKREENKRIKEEKYAEQLADPEGRLKILTEQNKNKVMDVKEIQEMGFLAKKVAQPTIEQLSKEDRKTLAQKIFMIENEIMKEDKSKLIKEEKQEINKVYSQCGLKYFKAHPNQKYSNYANTWSAFYNGIGSTIVRPYTKAFEAGQQQTKSTFKPVEVHTLKSAGGGGTSAIPVEPTNP